MLFDGDGLKHSTNGTWLYAERPFRIHDNLLFKAGNVLFQAIHIKGKERSQTDNI